MFIIILFFIVMLYYILSINVDFNEYDFIENWFANIIERFDIWWDKTELKIENKITEIKEKIYDKIK